MNKTRKLSAYTVVLVAIVSIAALMTPISMAQTENSATPFTAGPLNHKNGGPLWLQDSNGLTLELCLDPVQCFFDPVDPLNKYSTRVGFGPEAFWWSAESSIKDRNNKFSALVVMAAEFAWNNGDPEAGEQFPFTRLRFRIDPIADGIYKVTHPYGVDTFVGKKGERIFVTYDVQIENIPGKNQGKIGPFITRTYPPGIQPPDGYISGGLNDVGLVTGSPVGTNYFEVTATKLDGTPIDLDSSKSGVQGAWTDQFSVMGKKATRHGVQVNRADYDLDVFDPGIAVFASTIVNPLQAISITATGIAQTPMTEGLTDLTGMWRNYFGFIENSAPPGFIVVTNTADPLEDTICITGDEFGPSCESSVVQDLVDRVTITYAYFYRNTGELEIAASSSDPNAVLAVYTEDGVKLGDLVGGVLKRTVIAPSARVVVKSDKGGTDTESVEIGVCKGANNKRQC